MTNLKPKQKWNFYSLPQEIGPETLVIADIKWLFQLAISLDCALFVGCEIIMCIFVQSYLLVTTMRTSICLTHTQGGCFPVKSLSCVLF